METLTVGVKEAAEIAGVGYQTIREWCERGMPHLWTKNRGRIRIPRAALAEWIEHEAARFSTP
jgi:excisionase family DNA binding protein